MAHIAIFTLTSELHDEQTVNAVTRDFLGSLGIDYLFKGSDYSDYGSHMLNLIYVRTGGTEGIFKELLPDLLEKSNRPFYLLTSGKSNSLAASMEILSYLRQNNLKGEIIHGRTEYINSRISLLEKVEEARKKMDGCRLGVIGEPSNWLISSYADYDIVKKRLGIELVDVPMDELLDTFTRIPEEMPSETSDREVIRNSLPGANRIYKALRSLTGCEGDVPAMLSMKIIQSITGLSGFQANPSSIDLETGEILFAHCTIPLNMVERYEFDTHFESGIGVGIRGFMKEGKVTVFKISGDMSRSFIAEGTLLRNQSKPDLCRTQQIIQLSDKSQASYFLTNPIGNHHIIVPGSYKLLLEELLK